MYNTFDNSFPFIEVKGKLFHQNFLIFTRYKDFIPENIANQTKYAYFREQRGSSNLRTFHHIFYHVVTQYIESTDEKSWRYLKFTL